MATALQAFEIEPKPFDRLLDAYLRRHRDIGASMRRRIGDAAFGVMRWRRRLDGLLAMRGVAKPNHRQRAELLLAGELPGTMPHGFPGGAAAWHSFPDFLYAMLVDAHGAHEAAVLAESLSVAAKPTLRVNVLTTTRDEMQRLLAADGIDASPTACSPFGLTLEKRAAVEATPVFRRGMVEIQDEASQLAVLAADPQPGEFVLDACAGAGGKTLALAMLMENHGRIVASDIDAGKLDELRKRAGRAGATIVETVGAGALLKRREFGGNFDLVFLDAPCSGTGTLRRAPDLKWRISPEFIETRVALQRELLERHAARVRPGGRIVYVTCSLLPCENERVVEAFLAKGGFEPVDPCGAFERRGIAVDRIIEKGYFRADPRRGNWDGFFGAILRKDG